MLERKWSSDLRLFHNLETTANIKTNIFLHTCERHLLKSKGKRPTNLEFRASEQPKVLELLAGVQHITIRRCVPISWNCMYIACQKSGIFCSSRRYTYAMKQARGGLGRMWYEPSPCLWRGLYTQVLFLLLILHHYLQKPWPTSLASRWVPRCLTTDLSLQKHLWSCPIFTNPNIKIFKFVGHLQTE